MVRISVWTTRKMVKKGRKDQIRIVCINNDLILITLLMLWMEIAIIVTLALDSITNTQMNRNIGWAKVWQKCFPTIKIDKMILMKKT